MKISLTPLVKGLITAALMVAMMLGLYYSNQPGNSPLQYLMYVIYAAGILWTMMSYARTPAFKGKFGELFGQGFRCFIIATLILVVVSGIMSSTHPEWAQAEADGYERYMREEKKTLPADIAATKEKIKKQYTVSLISRSIFGYLIAGSVFAVAGATGILLTRRNKT